MPLYKIVDLVIFILSVVVPIILVIVVLLSFKLKSSTPKNERKTIKQNISHLDIMFRTSGKTRTFYDKKQEWLISMGIEYIFDRILTPVEYYLLKVGIGVGLFVLILPKDILTACLGLIFGYFLVDLALYMSNESDNDAILQDLQGVYDTLKIQVNTGIFFIDVLDVCYLRSKNKRFKKAMLILTNKLKSSEGKDEAINEFNAKFKNKYIDTFCMVLKQSLKSGQMSKILDDLSDQLKNIEKAINIKLAGKADRKASMVQMLVYVAVFAILIYGTVVELMGNLSNF